MDRMTILLLLFGLVLSSVVGPGHSRELQHSHEVTEDYSDMMFSDIEISK